MSGFGDDKEPPFMNLWQRQFYRNFRSGGFSTAPPRRKPEPVFESSKEPWPIPKPRTDLVFAKSCDQCNWGKTHAGSAVEPAANFGAVMIAGAMTFAQATTSRAIAVALGTEFGLARVGGAGILQKRHYWLIRSAGGPAGIFVLGMLPSQIADGTLYTDDQLRQMREATTRVRFQFRKDPQGELKVYGIHTTPTGDDTVPTVQARWNTDNTAIEATLNDITLIFTPREGRLGTLEPLTYPADSGAPPVNILVHPIPEGVDSQIEGLPGEDVTTGDCIVVFPASEGMRSMYVVFSRPFGGDHGYHLPPKELAAFPDAVKVTGKTKVRGGGGIRKRWKNAKGQIFEWDSQHGKVEMYDKQGKHLGEFDSVTGEQTKPAQPGREVEK